MYEKILLLVGYLARILTLDNNELDARQQSRQRRKVLGILGSGTALVM
jgi:hypothetical protein